MKKTTINPTRRQFVEKALNVSATGLAATTGIAALLPSCSPVRESTIDVPNINFNKTYRWKMTTTWPPGFPVVGEGCQMVADLIKKMSGSRMEITVYGGGELIPALEGFDAVSNGAIEMNHGASYYWSGKLPVSPFFAAVPFGMNAQQMTAWIMTGGGQALWEEVYAPYDLQPVICGNTGVQMAGWFNKEINSIADLKGLKMRIPGLGGKVFAKAGGTTVLVSGGEIYTNLERGVIDAAEWIGPYHDYLMGFHQVAKYYYYPGWQEPGPVLEMLINKTKFASLPADLQEIIRAACVTAGTWMLAEFDKRNAEYLQKIKEEGKVQFRRYPDPVIQTLKEKTSEIIDELVQADANTRKVYAAFQAFKSQLNPWMDLSERLFYEQLK